MGLAIAGLLLALYWPTLRWLASEWSSNDYYSHGPLVPLVAAFFAWRQRAGLVAKPSNRGLWGLGMGLALYLIAAWLRAPFVSAFSLIVVLAGLVLFLLGVPALRRLSFPLAFLCFMIPLPFVEAASAPLQSFTAHYATRLVQILGVPATNQGGQVTLAGSSLVVGAPCSGLRSIVAMLTLAAVLVFVVDGRWPGRVGLAVAAVPVAAVANVLRVGSLLLVAHAFGEEAGLRYYHDLSSPAFFLAAFGLLIGVGWVLGCRGIRSDI